MQRRKGYVAVTAYGPGVRFGHEVDVLLLSHKCCRWREARAAMAYR